MRQQALGVGPLRHFLRDAFVQFRNPAIQLRAQRQQIGPPARPAFS